jgi:hypothetical protein
MNTDVDNEVKLELDNTVQLISKEDVEKQFGEAMASAVSTDQVVTWAKFILTDDKPNENRQRIPAEEFDNLIRTGAYKPVKMALGEIKDGHEDARPLGVITNLTKEGNKVIALAALWDHERTEDVSTIKKMVKAGKPVNVSWEILYGNTLVKDGISDLLETVLAAATIVGMPAYAGRTQLLAVAAKKWSPAYISKLPDTSFLHIENDGTRYFAYRDENGKIDPSRFQPILEEIANAPIPTNTLKGIRHQVIKLNAMVTADASIRELLMEEGEDFKPEDYTLETKELESKVSELEAKLALANDNLSAKEKELTDALALAEVANTTVKTLEAELTPLRDFKLESDKVAEKETKIAGIKTKFESLGLTKADDYFETNAEKLLGLDENGLDFMLQEMVAFKAEDKGTGEASLKTSGVPNVQGTKDNLSDVKDLAAALRERNKK